MENSKISTPMMAQWESCKKEAGEAVLFFRMGDFYECFYEDAQTISKELELTLTSRQSIPMAGIPHSHCDPYIEKLIRRGYSVALAEQMEDPKLTKGLVKRQVVRIATPGTWISSAVSQEKNNLFFACIAENSSIYSIAYLDLSTGEFRTTELEKTEDILSEIYRLKPAEILTSEKLHIKEKKLFDLIEERRVSKISIIENWHFSPELCTQTLKDHLNVASLDGFGLFQKNSSICACGSLIAHIKDTLCQTVSHITDIQVDSLSHHLHLDRVTQRHLELTESLHDGSKHSTLLKLVDHTYTPMGARLMRYWIQRPLLDPKAIHLRQDCIESLLKYPHILASIQQTLASVRDMERLITRITNASASPRDLIALKNSLMAIPELKTHLSNLHSACWAPLSDALDPLMSAAGRIGQTLVNEAPQRLGDERTIREGFHQELDEIRHLSHNSKEWIAGYQNELKEMLQIKTLKIHYNRMFGYTIEVSKSQVNKIPSNFERRQTLVNGERYITAELKNYESKILNADDKIQHLESEIFHLLRLEISSYKPQISNNAHLIAQIDVLASLAHCAHIYHYQRPIVDLSTKIDIIDGRHPVLESMTHAREHFIPNSTHLDMNERMMLITGPNMAGKSTYIRQVALIVLLAQMGSFVPASRAHIGIVDKIFSRIGASDELSRGQSTFMVEMTETANILNNATDKSLVILDEIGRGTSTYDGISIAWALTEFLLTTPGKQAKTLFATHYSELTGLQKKIPGIKNYQVAISETENGIVFLRKIIPGGSDKSYGIHVAKLAGMPSWVIERAGEILKTLEKEELSLNLSNCLRSALPRAQSKQKLKRPSEQLSLFES